jgi:hypothetical protein
MKQPTTPPSRSITTRDTLRDVLLVTRDTGAKATARDLATAASISEKDVAEHLEHLARSLPREGLRLEMTPASCLVCAFVFGDRTRFTVPSACPSCRSERIAPPAFAVRAAPTRPTKRPREPHAADDDGMGDELEGDDTN